ncbi:hypothetical protein [Nocardia sp. X0981]
MSSREAQLVPEWKQTANPRFPLAAEMEGAWWVLRMNSFPDHCMWTLFVDGAVRYDLEEIPAAWGRPRVGSAPMLAPAIAAAVLAPIAHLVVYGSEVGQPCDDPFCCG